MDSSFDMPEKDFRSTPYDISSSCFASCFQHSATAATSESCPPAVLLYLLLSPFPHLALSWDPKRLLIIEKASIQDYEAPIRCVLDRTISTPGGTRG